MFTKEQQTRKQEIIALFAQGTVDDKLFQELKEINEAEKQAKVEREGAISSIADAIRNFEQEYGEKLSFADLMAQVKDGKPLFDSTEVMDFARGQGWKMAGANFTAAPSGTTDGDKKPRKPREAKVGTVLFEIQPPNWKGASTKILKGDKFPAQGIGSKLVWLFQQEGDLAGNLMAHAAKTSEVQEYLASDDGKAELQKWVKYIAENAPKKLELAQNPLPEDTSDLRETQEANQNDLAGADEGSNKKSRKK